MATMGQVFLTLGFVSTLVSIVALIVGHRMGARDGEKITNLGYLATFATSAFFTIATMVLVVGFFRSDWSLLYVVENHSTDISSLSWLYKLSGVWAGREGSLLFWAWLISVFSAYVAYRRMEVTDALSNMGIMVTNVVLSLFAAVMLFAESNFPFKATPAEFIGANGELLTTAAMNPLLQHWAMVIHPPTLFIGYAGLTIPFAFALAALIVNDASDAWVRIVDRITVFAWLFLGAGIGLGSVWAYVVLGWGGYWGWDPVENASLLPWLVGVALIHSFTIYRRRDSFKKWALVLAAAAFSYVILGTFITRSGLVTASVHAFGDVDKVSVAVFGFLIIAPFVTMIAGIFLRGDSFSGADEFESLTSKEAAYYFNNVIMLVAATLVAYLTVTSALPAWMPLGKQAVSITSYDMLARPIGILYALILAACPILSWRKTDGAQFWSRVKFPLIGAAVIFAALVAEWAINLRPIYTAMVAGGGDLAAKFTAFGPEIVYDTIALLGFFAGSIIIANAVYMFVQGARKRAEAKGESFGVALGNIMFKSRTQSGGYIAHLGMGIILIGLVGSAMYVREVDIFVPNTVGETMTVDNYTFTFKGMSEEPFANGDSKSFANFDVKRDGKAIGSIKPGMTFFAGRPEGMNRRLDAAVLSEPLRDVFLVWQGNQNDQSGAEVLSMNVKINPLIWFTWAGFFILMLGSALAAYPKKQPQLSVVADKKARK